MIHATNLGAAAKSRIGMPRRDSAEPAGAVWRLEAIHPRVIALTHLARRITLSDQLPLISRL
jgi:hypothetical protein